MTLVGKCARQKEFKPQRAARHLELCLLACALACTLVPSMGLAARIGDADGPTNRACVKYVSALEAALQRGDGARAQQTISDFFSSQRSSALKRCFLFRSGIAFHSQGQSSPCWTMLSAFFEAFPGHESSITAGDVYSAAYAKGGTCAAIEGHLHPAAALLKLALRLHPHDSQSWNNLANVYRNMGLTQKALEACVACALTPPPPPAAHTRSSYRTSESIDSSPDTIFNIAQLMRELGDNKATACESLHCAAVCRPPSAPPLTRSLCPRSQRAAGAAPQPFGLRVLDNFVPPSR
jgi:hypothetical protein